MYMSYCQLFGFMIFDGAMQPIKKHRNSEVLSIVLTR